MACYAKLRVFFTLTEGSKCGTTYWDFADMIDEITGTNHLYEIRSVHNTGATIIDISDFSSISLVVFQNTDPDNWVNLRVRSAANGNTWNNFRVGPASTRGNLVVLPDVNRDAADSVLISTASTRPIKIKFAAVGD